VRRWIRCPCRITIHLGLPSGEFYLGCAWEGMHRELGTHRCMFSSVEAFVEFRAVQVALFRMFGLDHVLQESHASSPSTPPRLARLTPLNSPYEGSQAYDAYDMTDIEALCIDD
jgi:hypothetical protein